MVVFLLCCLSMQMIFPQTVESQVVAVIKLGVYLFTKMLNSFHCAIAAFWAVIFWVFSFPLHCFDKRNSGDGPAVPSCPQAEICHKNAVVRGGNQCWKWESYGIICWGSPLGLLLLFIYFVYHLVSFLFCEHWHYILFSYQFIFTYILLEFYYILTRQLFVYGDARHFDDSW